jgi:diguanylate cyclase (GGDEF)-like protein
MSSGKPKTYWKKLLICRCERGYRLPMKTAVIISRDTALIAITERILEGVCRVVPFGSVQTGLDYIYSIIPNLLVVDLPFDDDNSVEILNALKGDPIFTHLPVLAVIDDSAPMPDWEMLLVEDYLWKAQVERDLQARARLSVLRAERAVEINPLTRLPGNIAIIRTIQALLDKGTQFGAAYADLDNFKPFNDHYGFSRGDEVIKMTGRLVLNTVKNTQPKGSFVGHIGGDDFIFVMDADMIEETAQEIVTTFDRIIWTFYDIPDRDAGAIISVDRQGRRKSFPVMSISIGVTSNKNRPFTHYGEITEAVSEMKRHAKRSKGSCFRSDRRQGSWTKGEGTTEEGMVR